MAEYLQLYQEEIRESIDFTGASISSRFDNMFMFFQTLEHERTLAVGA